MTESFTLLLIDLIYCFTKGMDDVKSQYKIGFVFIALMCSCIFIHVFFLFKDLVRQIILKFKKMR